MKNFFLLFLICFSGTVMNAQLISFKATTGDVEMDGVLTNVDIQARTDIKSFKNDVSVSFNIPTPQIDAALLLVSPGDLFMAAQLSISLNKPFETVVQTYRNNKTKGWGAIAKEMGIKPGSPEFHAMKNSLKSKGAKGKSNGKGAGNSEGKGKGNSNSKGKGNGKKK